MALLRRYHLARFLLECGRLKINSCSLCWTGVLQMPSWRRYTDQFMYSNLLLHQK